MKQLLLYILLGCAVNATAQNPVYLTQGRIEFEKKVNQHARLEALFKNQNDDGWKDIEKKAPAPVHHFLL